jgi:hypothetical protein
MNTEESSTGVAGFWSYTHQDDEHDEKRITQLASDLRSEYEMLTGESLTLFVDRDSLKWGAEWQRRIDAALDATTFFFALVTPRFFGSGACRTELLKFSSYARSLGLTALLMPLYYVTVPDFGVDNEDDAISLVAGSQYLDWRDNRFLERQTPAYRRAVSKAAQEIAKAREAVAKTPTASAIAVLTEASEGDSASYTDDEPGLLDLMESFETDLPRAGDFLDQYTQLMGGLTELVTDAGADFAEAGSSGKPVAYRLTRARRLARDLQGPIDEVTEVATNYFETLEKVDPAVRGFVRAAEEQQPLSEEDLEGVCAFFSALLTVVTSGKDMYQAIQGMQENIQGTERMSRDLRPVLRQLRAAAQRIGDGQALLEGWAEAVRASTVTCPDHT